MSKIYGFLLAALVVVLFSDAARAEGDMLLALNTPVKSSINPNVGAGSVSGDRRNQAAISVELKDSATVQLKIGVPGYTDFDAFSSVNDPLYREGSKELLKQIIKNDAGKKETPGETLRDAPISKEARPGAARPVKGRRSMRKAGSAKPLHADPVKVKNTF